MYSHMYQEQRKKDIFITEERIFFFFFKHDTLKFHVQTDQFLPALNNLWASLALETVLADPG